MSKPKVRRIVQRLGDVVYEGQVTYGDPVSSATRVAKLLAPLIADATQEVLVALLLDGNRRVSAYVEVTRGTLSSSLVHPREVFGPALRHGTCAALIVAHNHPSGHPEPSREDLDVTRRLIQAGKLLGVPVLDHVVIGADGAFVSIRERMEWD